MEFINVYRIVFSIRVQSVREIYHGLEDKIDCMYNGNLVYHGLAEKVAKNRTVTEDKDDMCSGP